jgi:hypothetical protein
MKKTWVLTDEEKSLISQKIKDGVPNITDEAVLKATEELVEDVEIYAGALFYQPGCLENMQVGYDAGGYDKEEDYKYEPEFSTVVNGRIQYYNMDGRCTGS